MKVVTGELHRVRRGRGKAFERKQPAEPTAAPDRRPSRAALTLAFAHHVQRAIDRGVLRNQADLARRLGTTRACATQVLGLTLLVPEVQERVLFARQREDGHDLRRAYRVREWTGQRALLRTAVASSPT